MKIFKAFTYANLQMFRHVLQGLEIGGVTSINRARELIDQEMREQTAFNKDYRSRKVSAHFPKGKGKLCPECSSVTHIMEVENLLIRSCRKCRWSELLEEGK
jgi:hypothetical protein